MISFVCENSQRNVSGLKAIPPPLQISFSTQQRQTVGHFKGLISICKSVKFASMAVAVT